MLRWMMGVNRIENIRNEEIRARAGAANISKKLRDHYVRLRWLDHVERKTVQRRCSNEKMVDTER